MKKYISIIMCSCIAISCNNSGTSNTGETSKEAELTDVHDITLEQALVYMSDFIVQYDSIAKNISMGGGFSTEMLRKAGVSDNENEPGKIAGTMFFETYDKSAVPVTMKLHVKQIHDYDTTSADRYHLPDNTYVFRPDADFNYNLTEKDTASVRQFINAQNQMISSRNDSVEYIRTKPIQDAFLVKFPVNRYPYGLFTESAVDNLIQQRDSSGNLVAAGIRYFYGLDARLEYNQIRLILIAVDQAGNNITQIDGRPAKIKERQIPPPIVQ